ncbi:hypothetical protein RND71_005425 [Anisodus tanguticus]|uniref:Isopenicillin N synthase-like Fe(2+) 2OG dioxygenase domain-containing protein n=1 Tax=Anisodus tanguticus TaxID=243964 RepID=A0AAE1SSE2_9SOLA|nr:hypothetical protein RND71_005425 [Anisodus tanguticus]
MGLCALFFTLRIMYAHFEVICGPVMFLFSRGDHGKGKRKRGRRSVRKRQKPVKNVKQAIVEEVPISSQRDWTEVEDKETPQFDPDNDNDSGTSGTEDDKARNFLKVYSCPRDNLHTQQLSELDQTVRRMILESLGVENYMDEHMSSTNYLLRVMKYKGPQSSETKLGLSAHTDKNIVTILYHYQVNGLEVLTKDVNVDPTPDTFTVMIEDSIAPKELVDEEHPLLLKPFDHVEFLDFYYTEEGQRCGSALKTLCYQLLVTLLSELKTHNCS